MSAATIPAMMRAIQEDDRARREANAAQRAINEADPAYRAANAARVYAWQCSAPVRHDDDIGDGGID